MLPRSSTASMSQPREMCSARAASSFSSAAKCSGVFPSVIEAPGTGFRNESLRANAEVLRRSDALRLSGALRLLRDALRLSDSVIAAGVSGISSLPGFADDRADGWCADALCANSGAAKTARTVVRQQARGST